MDEELRYGTKVIVNDDFHKSVPGVVLTKCEFKGDDDPVRYELRLFPLETHDFFPAKSLTVTGQLFMDRPSAVAVPQQPLIVPR